MANARSRSPIAREFESGIRTMMRMQDQLSDLKTQLEVKENLVGDLRAKLEDKNETILELKMQLAEMAEKNKKLIGSAM